MIGGIWPPSGIDPLSPWGVPLLNTVILLTSGATVTWAHHVIVAGKKKSASIGLFLTIVLAIIFTASITLQNEALGPGGSGGSGGSGTRERS